MPNIKSAKKRVLVNQTKNLRNKAVKSNLKTAIKKAEASVSDKAGNMQDVVRAAIKTIDKACSGGILHKNKAARKKSQLARSLNAANSN